jgi:3'-phosphoadenosine 5'-phosphosulfate sulfotransferase (PAPS reductase)/FAD synthetase
MKRIVQLSGGKDSTAVLIWAIDKYGSENVEAVFSDTGWESEETYNYLDYIEYFYKIKITRIKNKRYENGFLDMVKHKSRFPSSTARFCTDLLKIAPFIDYALEINDNITIYQGIRKDESRKRAKMNITDDYYLGYVTPIRVKDGKNIYHTYRRKDILKWLKSYSAIVHRPIFDLSADAVFDMHKKAGIDPNPLYKKGFSRVGCYPCIMCTKKELQLLAKISPEKIDLINKFEIENKTTFFAPDFIPDDTKIDYAINKKGEFKKITYISQAVKYVSDDPDQLKFFDDDTPSCSSIYNICE